MTLDLDGRIAQELKDLYKELSDKGELFTDEQLAQYYNTFWALFGFAYPAAPIPVALNMISKIMAFATAVSLFLPQEKIVRFANQFVPARHEIGQ